MSLFPALKGEATDYYKLTLNRGTHCMWWHPQIHLYFQDGPRASGTVLPVQGHPGDGRGTNPVRKPTPCSPGKYV